MFKAGGLRFILAALLLSIVAGCGGDSQPSDDATAGAPQTSGDALPSAEGSLEATGPSAGADSAGPASTMSEADLHPEVVINTSAGIIQIRLDAETSPVTVENFLENYVDRGFYDGTTFHYVEKDFMIIGGGYTPDGKTKETRAPVRNESHNGVKNVRGSVAMARHADYGDSATSQFFINLVDNPALDFAKAENDEEDDTVGYTVFGEVTQGMDVVDGIAQVTVHDAEGLPKTPKDPVVIQSVKRLP